jgi:hypothetical protein
MTGQQAVRSIDRLLDRGQQRKLNDLESTIVLQIWKGNTYRSIACKLSYDLDYIKQIAARLWKSLSKLLGENICKSNIKSVLERCQESILLTNPLTGSIADWDKPMLISDGFANYTCHSNETDSPNIETWMIRDRMTTIAFFSSTATNETPQSIKYDPPEERLYQRQIQAEIQSLIWQNLSESVNPNVLMNDIFSVLKVRDTDRNAINCLIVNCYF